MRVLIVEDDQETADYICSSLRELGHVFEHVADGKSGFLSALDSDFDVMVIDRMLPGIDGLSLVKSIRSADVATPIIFLSAMDGINDRVDGLEAGADDYLVKPFAFSELSARLTALAMRVARPLTQARPNARVNGRLGLYSDLLFDVRDLRPQEVSPWCLPHGTFPRRTLRC